MIEVLDPDKLRELNDRTRRAPGATVDPVDVQYQESRLPLDLALLEWSYGQLGQGHLIRRFLVYCLGRAGYHYVRARRMLRAVLGPRVSAEEYARRMSVCGLCEAHQNGYCKSCQCPRWILARLDRKNWYARWFCPLRRHPGLYPRYLPRWRKRGCGGAKPAPVVAAATDTLADGNGGAS